MVNPSLPDRFTERLHQFRYRADDAASDSIGAFLRAFRKRLPVASGAPAEISGEEIQALLDGTGQRIEEELAPCLEEEFDRLVVHNLQADHAFEVLFRHSRLLDTLHRFAFSVAAGELPLLARQRLLETHRNLSRIREQMPQKSEQLARLEAELKSMGGKKEEEIQQGEYYAGLASALEASLRNQQESVRDLAGILSDLENWAGESALADEKLVLFARGGYGRAEMSFSSDIDTGYCLDTRHMPAGVVAVFHDLVMRVEALLAKAGLTTAHQFFEIEEDLSRFLDSAGLHTFPAILESRSLAGNHQLLEALQSRFKSLLPLEKVARQKSEEFKDQTPASLTAMNLKDDFGGLRSIQIPLWLLGITHDAPDFMTVELLELAREKGLLSLWEVSHLLLALEFLYELRNFAGAAENRYYDREAKESGFHINQFRPNWINDQLVRLYLFRKHRFSSLDAFDAFRLGLVEQVQWISTRLMSRVLNRTLSQHLDDLTLDVHLGERRIQSISAPHDGGNREWLTLFGDSARLLRLFSYIANSDFDLAPELKDSLAGVVAGLTMPRGKVEAAAQAAGFSRLLIGPYAHRALKTMFEITDPLGSDTPSLIGRFIPSCEGMLHRVRRFAGVAMPLHVHSLNSLSAGQQALDALRTEYPELHGILSEEDVLALKWSLLLHDIARVGDADAEPDQSADQAAEILQEVGYRDSELESRVRLLISHHRSLAALSRTATYMDQALAQYYEIAQRNLVNAVLLYLVNLGVIQARGGDVDSDVASLKALFDEANLILGEMQGFPVKDRSLELINVYFDRKKSELLADTRLHLLYQDSVNLGLQSAVFEPVARLHPGTWDKLKSETAALERKHREILLGALERDEQEIRKTKFLLALRSHLGEEAVEALTAGQETLIQWFFQAFPNRYLMASPPGDLAVQLPKFVNFLSSQAIVDVVPSPQGGSQGLLIHTRGLSRSHSSVAYALSHHRLNIISGKVNRIEYAGGEHGYCYYFQISRLEPGDPIKPVDMERMIATGAPPELQFPPSVPVLTANRVRLEFRGEDEKGYLVNQTAQGFERQEAGFHNLKVVLRDEPFLFYKVTQAIDRFNVEVQQALITTTGHQVVDYFYFSPEDYASLQRTDFEERFIAWVQSDLMEN